MKNNADQRGCRVARGCGHVSVGRGEAREKRRLDFSKKLAPRSPSSGEEKRVGFRARARRGGGARRGAREGRVSGAEARTLMSVMDMPQFWSSSMQRNDCGSCSYCTTEARGGRASGTAQLRSGKGARARAARAAPRGCGGGERHRVERSNGAGMPISRDVPLPRPRRPRPRRPRPARSGRSPGRTAGSGWWASATASPRAAARGRPASPWWEKRRAGAKRAKRGGNARTTVARARGVTAAAGCREKKNTFLKVVAFSPTQTHSCARARRGRRRRAGE